MCEPKTGSVDGLTPRQKAVKRLFDLVVAGIGLVVLSPLILAAIVAATVDTREWGIFTQERIGRHGERFRVHKVRSMKTSSAVTTTVTTLGDPRITRLGTLLRRYKIDELPQLWDVVVGTMSLVGPRPDVSGWADKLEGDDRVVLTVRPGITGPASLHFRDEEVLLASVADAVTYNREFIWPEKVRLNRNYVRHWTLRRDIELLRDTIVTTDNSLIEGNGKG